MNKQELLSKLKAAETGSPELSAEVFKYLNPDIECSYSNNLDKWAVFRDDKESPWYISPQLTTSIDAAVKAVEDSGLLFSIEKKPKMYKSCVFPSKSYQECVHKSIPIAIMIALIEATEEGKT